MESLELRVGDDIARFSFEVEGYALCTSVDTGIEVDSLMSFTCDSLLGGRFLALYVPSFSDAMLHFCELKVYGQPGNILNEQTYVYVHLRVFCSVFSSGRVKFSVWLGFRL